MDRPQLPAPSADQVPTVLLAVSASLGLVLAVEIGHQAILLGDPTTVSLGELPWPYLTSFVVSLPFIAGIGYAGRYLASEPVPPERFPRIFKWMLTGIVVWVSINLLTMVSFGIVDLWGTIGWVRGAIAWGGAFGLLIGIIEARAISNAVAENQQRLRAEYLHQQRDTLDYFNSLLRHEVLNDLSAVLGHAELLDEELSKTDTGYEHVEPILRNSREIADVITDVRRIMDSMQDSRELNRLSIREVLQTEIEKIRSDTPEVEVAIDLPEEVDVYGDELLQRVFGNLLTNAVEHNDSGPPRIEVTASVTDSSVTVRVADNGPGIDPEQRENLFDRPDVYAADHGFGLYIVDQLCRQYAGEVGVTETGDDGTTIAVTLPRADVIERSPELVTSSAPSPASPAAQPSPR